MGKEKRMVISIFSFFHNPFKRLLVSRFGLYDKKLNNYSSICRAEEDERVAKELMEKEQLQVEAHRMAAELTDEVKTTFFSLNTFTMS